MQKVIIVVSVILYFISLGLMSFLLFSIFNSSGMQPLDLRDPIIQWHIKNSDILNNSQSVISEIVEDPRGWQAAGIDLQYTKDPQRARIIIILTEKAVCDSDHAMGCASSNEQQCTITLKCGFPVCPTIESYSYLTMIVNHEIGHCLLGPEHTSIGLISARAVIDSPFPSNDELQRVRERIKN